MLEKCPKCESKDLFMCHRMCGTTQCANLQCDFFMIPFHKKNGKIQLGHRPECGFCQEKIKDIESLLNNLNSN